MYFQKLSNKVECDRVCHKLILSTYRANKFVGYCVNRATLGVGI
jgi:hypothetical protein